MFFHSRSFGRWGDRHQRERLLETEEDEEGSDYNHYEDYSEDELREPEAADEAEAFAAGIWPFGCEGNLDDVPVPTGANCAMLSNMLSQAEGDIGEYSFGGQAEMLPALPGLFVDGVGSVPLPLSKEYAEILTAHCGKSPVGCERDPRVNEKERKSWQLHPDCVELKNPLWHSGMEKLSMMIADRLGYKGVPLQCLLYKLQIYGEGSRSVKHQETEEEEGKVATLVMQLPSLHEGGDLVVYQGGKELIRHDFGKTGGTAPYAPHYAVQYAEAEHSLEEVTSGCRLVLVYSICLPPDIRYLAPKNDKRTVIDNLTDVMKRMHTSGDTFALLLSHKYSEKVIGDLGSGALDGVDRAQIKLLERANGQLPANLKLNLYIAHLNHEIEYYETGGDEEPSWEEINRQEGIALLSIAGDPLPYESSDGATEKLNFLNPANETLSQLWKEHGTSTFEGTKKKTTFSRFAIIGWPAVDDLVNIFKFVGEMAGLTAFQLVGSIDKATLRTLLEHGCGDPVKQSTISLGFCQMLCLALVEVGDAALVDVFFKNVFKRLSSQVDLVPSILVLMRSFEWDSVGPVSMDAVRRMGYEQGWELALRVVDGLERGAAQTAMLKVAIDKGRNLSPESLASPRLAGLLWKWAIRCSDEAVVTDVVALFESLDPSLLSSVLEVFAQCTDSSDSEDHFMALASIAAVRLEWLKTQMAPLEKPFSWEMPEAYFPEDDRVEAFLRGPESTMTVHKFSSVADAQKYVKRHTWEHEKSSFEMAAGGRGNNAYVTITKTLDWFKKSQGPLEKYKTEVKTLIKRYGAALRVSPNATGRKRVRE
ncbi:hypothetical protein BBJ28_00008398 [Nothophytophthora sp. Chile5]|nr:hypothetical protein BBJ28_00008398 [Nothophytophthora sp. Chile5]